MLVYTQIKIINKIVSTNTINESHRGPTITFNRVFGDCPCQRILIPVAILNVWSIASLQ
jgi:hypothetical protein